MTTKRRPHPILWLPFYAYKYLIVIPTLLVSTAIIGTTIMVFCVIGLADFSSRVFGTLWARFNAMITLLTISVEGRDNIKPGQSYVIAANHQSLLDIYAIYGYTGLDIKWVMKKELRAVPILGRHIITSSTA